MDRYEWELYFEEEEMQPLCEFVDLFLKKYEQSPMYEKFKAKLEDHLKEHVPYIEGSWDESVAFWIDSDFPCPPEAKAYPKDILESLYLLVDVLPADDGMMLALPGSSLQQLPEPKPGELTEPTEMWLLFKEKWELDKSQAKLTLAKQIYSTFHPEMTEGGEVEKQARVIVSRYNNETREN